MVSLRVGGLSSSTLVGSCGMQRTAKTWTVRFALKSVSKCLDQCLRGLDCEELLIIPCSPCSLHTAESSRPGAPTSPSGSPRACLEGCCRLDGSWLSSQDRTAVLGGPGGLTSSRLVVIVSPCHFCQTSPCSSFWCNQKLLPMSSRWWSTLIPLGFWGGFICAGRFLKLALQICLESCFYFRKPERASIDFLPDWTSLFQFWFEVEFEVTADEVMICMALSPGHNWCVVSLLHQYVVELEPVF